MKFSVLLVALGLVLGELLIADDKNFKSLVLDSNKVTLVDFYADWCRHCKNLMPIIEQVSEIFEDMDQVQVVKVNGDASGKKLSKKYKIQGYPTLLLFRENSEPIEFDGSRDAESISNFIQLASGLRLSRDTKSSADDDSDAVLALDQSNIEALMEGSNMIIAVSTSTDESLSDIKTLLNKLASESFENEKDINFAHFVYSADDVVSSNFVKEKLGIQSIPSIQLHKIGNSEPSLFTGDFEVQEIVQFVNDEMGFNRAASGDLFSNAGRVMSLDKIARKASDPNDVVNLVDELENTLGLHGKEALLEQGKLHFKDDTSMLSYYRRIFTQKDPQASIKREVQRLSAIIEKHSKDLTTSAMEFAKKRVNILKGLGL